LSHFFLKIRKKSNIFSKMRVTDSFFWCRDLSSSLVTQGPRRRKRAGLDPSRHIFPRIFSTSASRGSRRRRWAKVAARRSMARGIEGQDGGSSAASRHVACLQRGRVRRGIGSSLAPSVVRASNLVVAGPAARRGPLRDGYSLVVKRPDPYARRYLYRLAEALSAVAR